MPEAIASRNVKARSVTSSAPVRVLLVNPPNGKPIQRRFVASYHAPNFLIPPLELMSVGAVARRQGAEVMLLDAMAERIGLEQSATRARDFEPDVILGTPGFQCFDEDVRALEAISDAAGQAPLLLFSYLASRRPEQALAGSRASGVLLDEPEESFREVVDRLARGHGLTGIPGLAVRDGAGGVAALARPRIDDIDALPFPDHGLVDLSRYNESFLPRPIGVAISARGCPHACTFCVRYYGRKVVAHSADYLLDHARELRERHGVRHLRFMDDTFTYDRRRTLEICEGFARLSDPLSWSCLTRADALDAERVEALKAAGCRRVYVGVESGSERVLASYEKGETLEQIRVAFELLRQQRIESSAFFIVGAPGETDEDVEASMQFARQIRPDYLIVTKAQMWPGTSLEQRLGEAFRFGLLPFRSEVQGLASHERYQRWQKRFYRRFYLRPSYLLRRLRQLASSPADMLVGFSGLLRYLVFESRDDLI